ncbi:MAG: hypothetical protein ACJ78Q_20825 [Chloroflexia bacterium]
MKDNGKQKIRLEAAPDWAEQSRPLRLAYKDVPALLLLDIPGEDDLEVASAAASNAIADPRSVIGRVFRPRCGLLALTYISNN